MKSKPSTTIREQTSILPKHRPPTPPGEMLQEEFLTPLGMTQAELAKRMGTTVQSVNVIIKGKRAITAATALSLADVLGTTPEFWLNLQMFTDLWKAKQERKAPKKRSIALKQAVLEQWKRQ